MGHRLVLANGRNTRGLVLFKQRPIGKSSFLVEDDVSNDHDPASAGRAEKGWGLDVHQRASWPCSSTSVPTQASFRLVAELGGFLTPPRVRASLCRT